MGRRAPGGNALPRPKLIRVEGDLAFVPLTRGYEAIIDAADAPLVEQWSWHVTIGAHGVAYAQRTAQRAGKPCCMLMHRIIVGAEPHEDVDHEDGDGLNNRRANLRRCTTRENMGNMRLLERNKLGVKGVCQGNNGTFVAQISRNNETIHLGVYRTVEEAAAAYEGAARVLFGEFANPTGKRLRKEHIQPQPEPEPTPRIWKPSAGQLQFLQACHPTGSATASRRDTSTVQSLADRGLVTWDGFCGAAHAEVHITPDGAAVVVEASVSA